VAFITPWFMQPNTGDADIKYTGAQVRSNFAGLFGGEGVLGDSTSLAVTQRGAGANFSVDVAAGWCVVQGDDATGQGMYLAYNNATVNVTTDAAGTTLAAPGSGTRTHRVVIQIKDESALGSWANLYTAVPHFVYDTGAGLPALPASALEIGRVSVASGQVSVTNANITDRRMWIATAGGVPTVLSSGDGPTSPYRNRLRFRTDLSTLTPAGFEYYTGSAWRSVANPPYVKVTKLLTATSVVSSGATVVVNWEASPEETDSTMWASGTPSVVTIPASGLYSIKWQLPVELDTGYARSWLRINGSDVVRYQSTVDANSVAGQTMLVGDHDVRLSVGDTVVCALSANADSLNLVEAFGAAPFMSVAWLRP
jgi:hypothetical protein